MKEQESILNFTNLKVAIIYRIIIDTNLSGWEGETVKVRSSSDSKENDEISEGRNSKIKNISGMKQKIITRM